MATFLQDNYQSPASIQVPNFNFMFMFIGRNKWHAERSELGFISELTFILYFDYREDYGRTFVLKNKNLKVLL